MCKAIEILEINSYQIKDVSVSEAMKKLENLKVLDLAGCRSFHGTAFDTPHEHIICTKLQRLILSDEFKGRGVTLTKDKLLPIIPKLQIELVAAKKFDLDE